MSRKAEQGTAGYGTGSLRSKVFGGTAQIVGSTRTDLRGAIETNAQRGEGAELPERVAGAGPVLPGQADYLTVRQVAAMLNVNVKTVYAAIRRGHLPALRIGEAIRVPRWALEGEGVSPPPQPASAGNRASNPGPSTGPTGGGSTK